MKKAQKEQAEQLVGLLDRVHDGVQMSIEAGQKDSAMDLLGQCQEGAISLGEMIEESEGEGFVTVRLLEEYCETVYQFYEKLQQGQSINGSKVHKSLRKSLIQVKNSVKNDIRVRTEAVFLPYKASMWDSLESVWKAADEDPDCDAYVIPIPYYDRNPDGSFREEHYEGDQYPKYVPITWYGDYDFAERQPDFIFIHNPYDECNYVTSVHPFFYARNLKQYTNQLVYIPYFILGEVDPKNLVAVKGMEHFCTTPGVIYADKVIVQSEDMRTVYISVMTEFVKEAGRADMDQRYWENKILGLGSPKVDRVLNTRQEDLVIPKEWQKIIAKPDGSWKNVIFYNTSVTTFLQYGAQYLEKMQNVLQVFYENRDNVALLWRPHPLMEATVQSMRPEIKEEYTKIIKNYREGAWGIYDDTAELDRAVSLCSKYYGDGSSVVKLCQEAGKPVMVQNIEVDTNDKYIKISLEDFIIAGKKMLFPVWDFDQICSYDLEKKCTTNLNKYMSSYLGRQHSYSRICNYEKDKYLFVPLSADNILLYDALNQEFDEIKIENIKKDMSCLFFEAVSYKDYIYLIPGGYDAIIRFDCKNKTVKYYNKWIDILHKNGIDFSGVYSRHGYGLIRDELYLSIHATNFILKINLSKEEAKTIRIDEKFGTCESICSDGTYCWIVTSKGIIIRFYSEGDKDHILEINQSSITDVSSPFSEIISFHDMLYLIPYNTNNLIEVNKKTFDKKIIEIGNINIQKTALICFCAKIYNDKLFMYSYSLKKMLVLDLLNYSFTSFSVYEDMNNNYLYNEIRLMKNNYNKDDNVYTEKFGGALRGFIREAFESNIELESCHCIGKEIWKSK